MNEIELATKFMEELAADPAHGYDQAFRWGPDYDCSSAIITAWEQAGVPVKTNGATYTGNMYQVFIDCGFEDVTSEIDISNGAGLQRGDVLLNHRNHTAMYAGGGKTVEASINEYGTTTGGQTGDQNGKEILLRLYRNYPWDCVLRYAGVSYNDYVAEKNTAPTYFYSVKLPLLKKGHVGPYVFTLQYLLAKLNYYKSELDGIFGPQLESAVKEFQADNALEADGEVGGLTWAELMGG